MLRSLSRIAPLLLAFLLPACGGTADEAAISEPESFAAPEDLVEVESAKADGSRFESDQLIDDYAFTDSDYLSLQDIDDFLASTPYGRASFLHGYSAAPDGNRSVAEIIKSAAKAYQISPLVLLVKLQVEMGLINSDVAPSRRRVEHAMGCACPDNAPCSGHMAGFAAQIACSASTFRSYLTVLNAGRATVSGWRVGKSKRSSDGHRITPKNAATAALYTYTPWVLQGRGGNWLFWNVYRKYSRFVRRNRPNHRWIGGPCKGPEDCPFQEGICIQGESGGFCSTPCDRYCADSLEPYVAGSFCVDASTDSGNGSQGICIAQCNLGLYPDTDGCREGTVCMGAPRFGEPTVSRQACLPWEE